MNANNNVTPIESKRPQATAIHAISYVLDGFPVTTTIETTATISEVIGRLKAIGAQPPLSPVGEREPSPVGNTSTPVCEYHGAMKASTARPGTFFCPKRMGNGEYCKSKG